MTGTKEWYELMKDFEKTQSACGRRLDKENKINWPHKAYYQDGLVNQLFIAFMEGNSRGKCVYQL